MRRRGPAPRTVLAIASLGAAVAFVDATIVNIAFPSIEQSFPGTSVTSLSWVLNAYNIVFASFLVAAGRIADLLGRRRMFNLGLIVFTGASLLCAAAPSVGLLVAFRVVQAGGAALLVPASLALVLHAFPPDRRAHGVALLSAAAAAAAGLGPSLGGVLVAASNWRLVFLVNLPIGAAAVALSRRHLIESRTPGRRRMPDLIGAVLLALSVGGLVLAIVKGQDWGWTGARVLASFAVAIVLMTAFAWRCTWHRSPIVELPLLRIRTFTVANAMTIVACAGFYGYTLSNVLFLTGVWGYSVLQAGLALTPGPIVAALVAGTTGGLVQRIGHRTVLVVGGLVWGAGLLWFVERIGVEPAFLSEWLPGIVVLGIGAGLLLPNLSGVAVASAPGESFATATALNSVARQVGAALGVAVVVMIIGMPSPLQALGVFDHTWEFGMACMFGAAAGCLFVGRLKVAEAPSVAEAARSVLRPELIADTGHVSRPRARRVVELPHLPAARSGAETPVDFLRRVPMFAELDGTAQAHLGQRARTIRLAAGEWLFRQGELAETMYVVSAGRLEVVDDGRDKVIRELGRGDVVGELGPLTASPRSAAVRAARSAELLALDRADIEAVLQSSPALAFTVARTLARQLAATHAAVSTARPRPTTIALLAAEAGIQVNELARRLTQALSEHVNAGVLEGQASAAQSTSPAGVYGPMLDWAEGAYELVVLSAGSLVDPDSWTEFCLEQADRILVVSRGGPVDEKLRNRSELTGCELVAHDVPPASGLLAELATLLDPVECHVLRAVELDQDMARLARRLTGRSVGIVLSGGGARALAHIGVLEELTAAGVTIDRVLGVSMGAFIGGLFALGLDADEIDARCFEEWVQRRPLGDYTFPRHGFIRGQRVHSMLTRTFGDVRIEELARSFTSGYAELRSGSLLLARHGPLWEGVGFSICLPIIGAPQVRGRRLIVDGSLVDNLPVGVMSDLGEGPIIAVDVKAAFERPPESGNTGRDGLDGSGDGRVPGLAETLTRVLLLGSSNTTQAAREHADVVIEPRPEGVGLLEFHQIDAAREAGRVAARKVLEQLESRSPAALK